MIALTVLACFAVVVAVGAIVALGDLRDEHKARLLRVARGVTRLEVVREVCDQCGGKSAEQCAFCRGRRVRPTVIEVWEDER